MSDSAAYIDKYVRAYSHSLVQYHIVHYNTPVSYFSCLVYNSPFVNYSLYMDILSYKPFIEFFPDIKMLISYPYDDAVEFIFLSNNVAR